MNIVLVSSEVVPFAKTGGLADVAGALPKALRKLGHQVCVFMPKYKCIDKKKFGLKTELRKVRLRLGKPGSKEFNIYSSTLPDSDVPVYFIDKELYFNRDELYQEKGIDYTDNAERFFYFNLAVLESLKVLDIKPDVIHCNDWQTAMIPLYIKTQLKDDPFFSSVATVYTIHNLAYHGLFDAQVLDQLGIPNELFHADKLEFWGKVNFSKGGLIYSDIISTVSDRYSKEIQTSEFGCGLDGLLKSRASDLFGIINGLDYDLWDPMTDKHLLKNYSLSNLGDKQENKRKLLELNGLEYKPEVPVFGLISRLADQKGFDILAEIMDKILEMGIQFVLLGTGDPKYHTLFSEYQAKYPTKFKANLKFDAFIAQMIYAGSDMFLMPSHYEPCGLGQLISLKYGTVPVVRSTGGLADSIIDIDQNYDAGNGYAFDAYNSTELLHTLYRAVDCFYNHKDKWYHIQANGMNADFSWTASAKKYETLFQTAKDRVLTPVLV